MLKKQIDAYRKELELLATKLNRSLTHDQLEVMRMDFADVPGGPMSASAEVLDSGIQEVESGLIAKEESLLGEVNAALARIDAGTFGLCETCKRAISRTRLDAVPYSRQCIRCAKVAEKNPHLEKAG